MSARRGTRRFVAGRCIWFNRMYPVSARPAGTSNLARPPRRVTEDNERQRLSSASAQRHDNRHSQQNLPPTPQADVDNGWTWKTDNWPPSRPGQRDTQRHSSRAYADRQRGLMA